MRHLRHIVRGLLTLAANAYLLALIAYLFLRVIFGDGFWWLSLLNSFAHLLFLPLLILLPAPILLRSRTYGLRLLPFCLIGGLWFGPYYLPKPFVVSAKPTITILTFNIWGDNSRLGEAETWIRETGADIVCLQEIPESYSQNGLPQLKDQYPYQFVQNLELRVWGNLILSRFPFQSTENFDLENDGTPSHQRVTFELNGQTTALYNIHLLMPIGEHNHFALPIDNPFLQLALRYDDSARNQQIDRLIEQLVREPYPFIMVGDFNLSDQSVIYGKLAAEVRDTFREVGTTFGGSWPLGVNGEIPAFVPPLFRIDYVWHTDQFRAVAAWQGPRLGSDHLPLLATLELPGSH